MDLTDHEKAMLDGKFGEGVAKAMKIQVALGDAFDAERMAEISRAHVAFGNLESDIWFVELLLKGEARCRVSPTNNPLYDSDHLHSIGQSDPEEDAVMAAYNVSLMAGTLGLGTCFVSMAQKAISAGERIRKTVGLKKSERIHAVLAVGYPLIVRHRRVVRAAISSKRLGA